MSDMISDADLIRALRKAAFSDGLKEACDAYLCRIDNDNDFEPETNGEHRFLDAILPFCRTVFDVGACVGEWSEKVLAIKPDLELHSFEPMAKAQQTLTYKVGGKAIINCFALGKVSGKEVFHSAENYPQLASSFERPWFSFENTRADTVDVMSLTDYCDRHGVGHIDLLKIDVEGSEMDVLEGGIDLFRQGRVMAAQVEYGGTWIAPRRQLRDLFDLLAGTDYVVAKLMPDGCRVVERYDPSLETYRYSNWLILQQEMVEVVRG
ncbi:FkbM family methyltransferase [Lacibacterium aquatile]|uniref:FkbM family methyltransferase n=1 Tax=Lacibacterium aquatile TaxID=1168082 RepID=A0ABW5DUE3_9PROT